MEDLNRSLGRMEGKLDAVQADLEELKEDVKELRQFKTKIAGGAVAISMFISVLFEAFKAASK